MMLGICWAILSSILAGGHDGADHGGDAQDSGLHFLDQLLGSSHVESDFSGDGTDSAGPAGDPAGGLSSDSATMHPSPFSPLFLAVMATSFGAIGLLLTNGYGLSAAHSFLGATAISIILAWYVSKLFIRIFIASQTDSLSESYDAIGEIGDVDVPIPVNGTGSVSYHLKGRRFTAPAICETNEPLARGQKVTLLRFEGNKLIVKNAGDPGNSGNMGV
jgi:membrane protein implicated in regulation of membrane protease activity